MHSYLIYTEMIPIHPEVVCCVAIHHVESCHVLVMGTATTTQFHPGNRQYFSECHLTQRTASTFPPTFP